MAQLPQDEIPDLSGIDVWAADFDPTTVFDEESLEEIKAFFISKAGDVNGQIRYVLTQRTCVYLFVRAEIFCSCSFLDVSVCIFVRTRVHTI